MNASADCVLRARGIHRGFPGVRALEDAELCLRAGEVHALMGQNGAGKSTLIKVLTGVCAPHAGTIELDGARIQPTSPLHAQQLGISTVYQEVNLCPNLSVAENILAGRYPRRSWMRGGGIDWAAVHTEARGVLTSLQLDLDVTRLLSSYPVPIQQMVAIARATSVQARVLILDEPTSSLDESEVRQLFVVLDRLRQRGIAILFVSHFLDQVYAIADRITVLRNGRFVGEHRASELDRAALIAAMVGRDVVVVATSATMPASASASGLGSSWGPGELANAAHPSPPLLRARGICRKGQLSPTDIEIGRGEIVGVAGLLGSGRTELARLLFGLDPADAGEFAIEGAPVATGNPAEAIARGLAMCPEERKTEGLIADLSVRENIALAYQARAGLTPCLSPAAQRQMAERYVSALGIRCPSVDVPVGQLSGGNQQKVLLARWLATSPKLLILDEPTRGVDVAARQEIMDEIVKLAREGLGVLFISAEIEEVVRLAARVIVMRDRAKIGELPGACDEHEVFAMIAGNA
jgi:simple sugar transport system ATP-binding protein